MCLILFAHRHHSDYPLVVAANRDEFYRRPTQSAHFWARAPDVLGGLDTRAGGTWLGVTRSGRFAAITNYRDGCPPDPDKQSRGRLTQDFLQTTLPPADYLRQVHARADNYNGFNLLLGDRHSLFYYSNRIGTVTELEPGIYGLSNDLLDTPWPKVETGKAALRVTMDNGPTASALLDILADDRPAQDSDLPGTGVPLEWERRLSPRFIKAEDYGTRASTAVIVRGGEVEFTERNFVAGGVGEVKAYRFGVWGHPK